MNTKILPVYERIKLLRKSKGWTQHDLAEKMGTDARMISLYESKKTIPSAEALIKIAEIFNVSIDYLLIENAPTPKRPLNNNGSSEFLEKFSEFDKLTDKEKESIMNIIDSLITKNKVRDLITAQ